MKPSLKLLFGCLIQATLALSTIYFYPEWALPISFGWGILWMVVMAVNWISTDDHSSSWFFLGLSLQAFFNLFGVMIVGQEILAIAIQLGIASVVAITVYSIFTSGKTLGQIYWVRVLTLFFVWGYVGFFLAYSGMLFDSIPPIGRGIKLLLEWAACIVGGFTIALGTYYLVGAKSVWRLPGGSMFMGFWMGLLAFELQGFYLILCVVYGLFGWFLWNLFYDKFETRLPA